MQSGWLTPADVTFSSAQFANDRHSPAGRVRRGDLPVHPLHRVSEYTARTIDEWPRDRSRRRAGRAAPRGRARREVRHLELLVEHHLDAREAQKPDHRAEVASWRAVQAKYKHYQALPRFEGEQPLQTALNEGVVAMQGALARLLLEDEHGRLDDARRLQATEVEPVVAQLLASSVRLITFNTQQAERLAVSIGGARSPPCSPSCSTRSAAW